MSRFAELLARSITAGSRWDLTAEDRQRDQEMIQEARELDDERTAQDVRIHNLEVDNDRLRGARNKGGRAVETATEAYVRLGIALLALDVPEDTVRAAIIEVFRSTGSTRAPRSAKNLMLAIALRQQHTS